MVGGGNKVKVIYQEVKTRLMTKSRTRIGYP